MLNNSDKSGHPCFILNPRAKLFNLQVLGILLAVGLSYMAFIMLMYVPSIPTLLKVFIINGCWILLNAFSASIDLIMWFLSFIFLNVIDHVN